MKSAIAKVPSKNGVSEVAENQIVVKKITPRHTIVKVKSRMGSTYIPHKLTPENVREFGVFKKQMGQSVKKTLRNLDAEYESCFYRTVDGKYGIPAASFAASILDAAVACMIPKTQIKRAIRIIGDIYELKYEKLNKREDVVRQSGMTKAPDIRIRPEFINWSCDIAVQFDENQISGDQIVNLINQAGFSTGVGDWRPGAPKSSGTHGMFEVVV